MNHYHACLHWIMCEQRGLYDGDVGKVSGWKLVRMVADVWGKEPHEVALDLIERYDSSETVRKRRKHNV
jgi:hypothetical protein